MRIRIETHNTENNMGDKQSYRPGFFYVYELLDTDPSSKIPLQF